MSEYRRSICQSAERSLSRNNRLLERPKTSKREEPVFKSLQMPEHQLNLPSYKEYDKNRDEIIDLEAQHFEISQQRDTLFAEYDKMGAPRTLKAKQRSEELEREIDRVTLQMA